MEGSNTPCGVHTAGKAKEEEGVTDEKLVTEHTTHRIINIITIIIIIITMVIIINTNISIITKIIII